MQKKWLLLTILLAVTIGTLFIGCKRHCSGFYTPEERITHLIDKIEKELDLDAAQKDELQQITWEIKDKMTNLKEEKRSKHKAIVALIRKEQVTADDIDTLMMQHHQKMEDMVEFAGQRFIRFHTLLTPEQREKLATMIETHL
jgi:Spy/CpxP family protein refolding chaperone